MIRNIGDEVDLLEMDSEEFELFAQFNKISMKAEVNTPEGKKYLVLIPTGETIHDR